MPSSPRTVKGPTDHVVIIGAGLSGLSAAMRLAGTGRQVTVVDDGATPGGRGRALTLEGASGTYHLDSGPTVLTMPALIEDCFDALGTSMSEWLKLQRLDPLYEARFADGSSLLLRSDTNDTATEIAALAGQAEADGFHRYVDYVSRLYKLQLRDFIDRNIDSPLDLVTPNFFRLLAAGGFGKLAPKVAEFFKDDRLQRIFSFQSLYAGVAPQTALALYAVIAYMDSVAGVFYPEGGMAALPQAMADAAAAHGVTFRYNSRVDALEKTGQRVTGLCLESGERIAADSVIITADLPVARRDLLGQPLKRPMKYSPSCFLLLAGGDIPCQLNAHHAISFGHAWDETFEDLEQGRLMRDPSLMVCSPSRTDNSMAPAGKDCAYILAPTPHLGGNVDWPSTTKAYRDDVLKTLQARGFDGLGDGFEVEKIVTPTDWEAAGMEKGTPFAAAHTFSQTGPFRPSNMWGDNVVFAGSGTIPGVGVPMVLVSGRLAAERITGLDPNYSSRTWADLH